MEYIIKGFESYKINDDCRVTKTTQTSVGEKVKTITPYRPRDDCEYQYIRLSRTENGKTVKYTLSLDEVFCCARLGIEPGTPEGKSALKQYRHENGVMGRVVDAMGDFAKEQQLVNLLHADLVRQMHNVGINVDVDSMTVFVVAQLLLDYLKICKELSSQTYTNEIDTRTGTATVINPLMDLKLKVVRELTTGLRGLGLTFERVIKVLPSSAIESVSSDMFEQKEREEAIEKKGITWVS